MRKFKVNYTTKTGRKTHRHFIAPNLLEAQAQFEAGTRSKTGDYEWVECPYIDLIYKDTETGEVLSQDTLYLEYLAKHPNKEVSFIGFRASQKTLKVIER